MRKCLLILSIIILLAVVPLTYSHPGGTDSSGCHTCRTNCEEKYGIPTGFYHRNDPVRECTVEITTQPPVTTPVPTTTTPPTTTPAPEVISSKKPQIIVLANTIDYELATDFFGFLGNKGMEVIHIDAAEFEEGGYREEKFIVILGGPDAYEGVGEIVQQVLSEEEQDSIRETGARKKYVKTNKWAQGQRVTVIAGSDRNETKNSEDENKDSVTSDAEASS